MPETIFVSVRGDSDVLTLGTAPTNVNVWLNTTISRKCNAFCRGLLTPP
jgi:hypothetical protein